MGESVASVLLSIAFSTPLVPVAKKWSWQEEDRNVQQEEVI